MATPKIRVIYREDHKGVIHSFTHLERRESLRTIKILKILSTLEKQMPSFEIAEKIGENLPATQITLYKLAGAQRLDIKTSEGIQVIAERPFINIKKEETSKRNNFKNQKHLCATMYVEKP